MFPNLSRPDYLLYLLDHFAWALNLLVTLVDRIVIKRHVVALACVFALLPGQGLANTVPGPSPSPAERRNPVVQENQRPGTTSWDSHQLRQNRLRIPGDDDEHQV